MPSQCSFLGKLLVCKGKERKVGKMSERKVGGFDCPYASNPYHDCSELCFEEVSEKIQDDGKKTDKRMKKLQRKSVTSTSSKALKPFNSCAGNFCSMNSRSYHGKRIKGMWLVTDRSGVYPDCNYASNPYHRCAEYCFNNVLERDQPGQVMKLKSLEGDKTFSTRGRTSLHSQCIYASIAQHECTEVCFQNVPDNNTHEDVFAALNSKEEIKTLVAAKSGVKLECLNDQYFSQNLPEHHRLEAMMKAREENKVVSIPQREVNSSGENMTDSYIEYCFKSDPEKYQHGLAAKKPKEEGKMDLPKEIWVNPECQFASNPYHACAEYCFQNDPRREWPRHGKKLRSLKEMVSNKETRSVHLQCKFASNPYHECSGICFQNELGWNEVERVSMKLRKENKAVVPGERGVDPNCQYASNPYHVCAEYCIQNESVRKKKEFFMKLNNQRELKKEVSNRNSTNVLPRKFASNSYHECDLSCFQNELDQNIAEGVTESKEGKKETSCALRSEISTKSKFGSNSFHKFSECCSEEHPDKDQPVECIPDISKGKKRNSSIEKGDHLIMNKSTVNMEFLEASKPIYNNVESSVGIILPDQIDESSMDSKFVEVPNLDSDYAEFYEGITMQAITEDLMPEKDVETEITREASDVQQPLQVYVSDLFLEWAKYCSKEKAPEYKIVTQEMRAFKIKNHQDNDNLKRRDSSNLENDKAVGSLQRSLPISVLFFIGFLVALFKWTQMVLSKEWMKK